MPTLDFSIETSGPIFDSRKSSQRVDKVSQAFVQRMVELGEQRIDQQLRPRPMGVYLSAQEARPNQATTGNYRRNISGKVRGLLGTIDDGKVIYGAWLEGTSNRNAASQFKGYAVFRKTKDWMQKQVGSQRKEFERRYARKLNGI